MFVDVVYSSSLYCHVFAPWFCVTVLTRKQLILLISMLTFAAISLFLRNRMFWTGNSFGVPTATTKKKKMKCFLPFSFEKRQTNIINANSNNFIIMIFVLHVYRFSSWSFIVYPRKIAHCYPNSSEKIILKEEEKSAKKLKLKNRKWDNDDEKRIFRW